MDPNDIAAILAQLISNPYITQEVPDFGDVSMDAAQPSLYVQNGMLSAVSLLIGHHCLLTTLRRRHGVSFCCIMNVVMLTYSIDFDSLWHY